MKKLRLLTVLVTFALILAVTAGCQPAATTTAAPTTTQAPTTTEGTTAPTEIELPLTDTPVTYSIFAPINRNEADYSKNEIWAKITELTNIKFEWECVPTATANERMTLILASKQYPDIINTSTGGAGAVYPGGLEVGVDDGVFIDLKPLLAENAPLYWDYLSKDAGALRDATTDKGYIPAINEVNLKDTTLDTGLWCNVTRGDWLKDLNLEVPQTIDEWHTVLTAFKEEKDATFPLLWMLGNNQIWAQAYGINLMPFTPAGNGGVQQFYLGSDNKIHYGGIEQGFQDYLMTMSQWYAEGLYDRDFTTRGIFDLPTAATLFGTGQAGVTGGFLAWTGMYMGANGGADADFEIAVCPTPVLKKGDKGTQISTKSQYLGFSANSITTTCENPELFLQLINFMSSEDGQLLMNYGVEGVHYTMAGDKPTFTDKILKDAMGAFDAHEVIIGNMVPIRTTYTNNMLGQLYSEATIKAAEIPSNSTNVLYMYYSLNEAEAQELADIFGDINTYVGEQYALAVMDPTLAAKWMDVQAEYIKGLEIDRAIEIVQGAWDRYQVKG